MSLILDALKKLDREKGVPVRGTLVIGGTAWPGWLRAGAPLLVLLLLAFGTGLLAALFWFRSHAPAEPDPPAVTSEPLPPTAAPAVLASAAGSPPSRGALSSASKLAVETEPLLAAELPSSPSAPRPTRSPRARTLRRGVPAPEPFTLQAISERDGRPVAIINDHLLREGDSLEGARVVHITADQVELQVEGRRVILRF